MWHSCYIDNFFTENIYLFAYCCNLLMAIDIKNINPWFLFPLFLLCLSPKSHVCIAADTIFANQSLSGDQTIVSAGGIFVLGFFKPGNSSNSYIGIWYKKVSEQSVVWVANRDKPISDSYSSVLRISYGNLVLFDEFKTPVWSTNVSSTTSTSVEAVLLDVGNLVLRERSNNLTELLWQSFDHPTHTWLPTMKFGYNKRTNVIQTLTTWKNKEDPAPGLFSFALDPRANQYFMSRNRSESGRYWNSGHWNGQFFSMVPEMRLSPDTIYNISYVDNENETYFVYTVKDSTIARFIMDFSGQAKQAIWLDGPKSWLLSWAMPRLQCQVYGFCGVFGSCNEKTPPFCVCVQGFKPKSEHDWNLEYYAGGCERKTQLQCGNNSLANEKSDRFLESPNMVLPEHQQSVAVRSMKECEATCFNNCTCTAYAYENNECSIWVGDLLNLQQLAQDDPGGKTIYIKLAASEFSTSKDEEEITIGVLVGPLALVVLLGLVLFVYLRRRKRKIKTTEAVEGTLMAFAKCNKEFLRKTRSWRFWFCFQRGVFKELIGREFSRVLTTMRGTRGYLAPEWISGVAITTKADVYSYGMMLFEFVSEKRNCEQSKDRKNLGY